MEDDRPQSTTEAVSVELAAEPAVRRALGMVDPSFYIIGVGASAAVLMPSSN